MKKTILSILFISVVTYSYSQELLKTIENAHAGQILSFSINNAENTILTSGSDKRTYLWDLKTGKKIKSFAGHSDKVTGVSYSSNNKLFVTASADKRLVVWDSELGKPKKILQGHEDEIICIALNPINDNIASGSKDKNIILWDASGKLIATLEGHSKQVNAVTFSSDGKLLASGSSDNTIKIWDASTWELINTIEANSKGVISLRYSSDNKYLVSGGMNNSVILWDANSCNQLSEHSEHKSPVNSVIFSADVQYVASAGSDKKIVIWDVETRQPVKNFAAHNEDISAIAFNDKGTDLISAGYDGNVNVWDVSGLNIGKKKYTIGTLKPKIVCSALILKESNNNGILEPSDKPSLNFTIMNEGKGTAYDIVAKIEATSVEGLSFDKEYLIGNLSSNKKQKVEIPIFTKPELETSSGTFTVTIIEANSFNPDPLVLNFQTKGEESYSYIMVMHYEYSSATGKAEIGAPITLKLKLQNTSKGAAKDIKVNYIFPEHIMAVDKLSELIPSLAPGEMAEVSVEFYAKEEFTATDMKIRLNIEGATYTNVNDLNLDITMNEELPVSDLAIAQITPENQTMYRGSGDPLKGLNVSKAADIGIGSYYALIIGIDSYKGFWPALQNAVNDAKAIEAMLNSKYKFEHFRKLYDEQATRENIIKEMEWLVANVKEKDNLFIYYSGHGEFKKELNKGYWVPVDAQTASTSKYISNSDIKTFLGGIKSKHTLLVSDACFSGDIFRGSTISVPFDDSEKYYREVHELSSRQAMTSGGLEPVMDGGRDGHSVFAYYFLKVLENNNSKYFDAGQVFTKIKIPVTNNSEQSPKFSPIKDTGDEGGQFIFIKK
ncbi:MAG: caspase family protein [Bacteroidota bacterium]